MKILMTQRDLVNFGGTEMFTVDVSKTLAKRGHEVAVYTQNVRGMGEHIFADGVEVYTQLKDVPWVPDLIHGHHHLPAITALTHFGDCPAIYYCHGSKPWPERPPIHPRILRYVMMCESMVVKTTAMFQLPKHLICFIPNFVNLQRFSVVKSVPHRPSRALLYSQGGFSEHEIQSLKDACKQLNLSLDFIGYPYKNPKPRPEQFLQDYDIVFAIGKSAYEALACGCAVIPITPAQPGSLITTENLERYIFTNLSVPQFSSSERIGVEWLAQQIERYHADDVSAVTQHVRHQCTLDACVDKLESIYQSILSEPKVKGTPSDASHYLESIWPTVDSLAIENGRIRSELRQVRSQNQSSALKEKLETIQKSNNQLRLQLEAAKAKSEARHQAYLDLETHYKMMTSNYQKLSDQVLQLKAHQRELSLQSKANQRVWQQIESTFKDKILAHHFWKKIQRIRKKHT